MRDADDYLDALYPERVIERKRLYAAMLLAKDLDACEALLRGEAVPEHKLRPEALHLLATWPGSTDSQTKTPSA